MFALARQLVPGSVPWLIEGHSAFVHWHRIIVGLTLLGPLAQLANKHGLEAGVGVAAIGFVMVLEGRALGCEFFIAALETIIFVRGGTVIVVVSAYARAFMVL